MAHACSRVLTARGEYEICDECGWEDDPVQSSDDDYAGGANRLSLNQARNEYNHAHLTDVGGHIPVP